MPLPEASFLAIADDLPVGISLAKGPDGELIYRNKAYRQMMKRGGRTAAHTRICHINSENGPDHGEDSLFVRAVALHKVVEEDVVVSFSDGSNLHARVAAHPVALEPSEGGAILMSSRFGRSGNHRGRKPSKRLPRRTSACSMSSITRRSSCSR